MFQPHVKALEELRLIVNLAASGKLLESEAEPEPEPTDSASDSGVNTGFDSNLGPISPPLPRCPAPPDENRDSGAYGGPAMKPRNKIFEGCLYVRLNPKLENEILMDTKCKDELAKLRSSTETWLEHEDTKFHMRGMVDYLKESSKEPPSAHERTRALDTHSSAALHMSTEERRSHERSAIQATLRQAMHAQRSVFGQTIHDPSDAFAAFDRDGSGKLSPDELFKALQRLGLGLGEQQLSLLGAFLDEDGDGEVDYGELLSFLSDGHEESTAVQTHPLPTQQRQTAQALQAGADDDPDADAPAPPPAPLWSDELEAPAPTTADTRTLGEALEPEPESEPDVIDRSCWEYDRPGKGWQAYDDEAQQQLRSSFAADPNGTCAFQQTAHMPASDDEVFNYKVDFSTGPNFKVQLFKPFDTDRVALWDVRRRDSSWCLTHEARDGADAPLRILCIDGGGSKGLIPAITMQKIEQMCAPHQIHELFDVVAGTSTGGILALGTCIAGATAEEMAEVYETRSDEIWTTKRGGGSWNFLSAQAQYDAAKLTAILKESSVGRDGTTQVGIEHFLPCFKSIILVYFGLL